MLLFTNLKKYLKKIIYVVLMQGLFLLPLFHAWLGYYPFPGLENPYTLASALNGIIPINDAGGYYHGANLLLDQGSLNDWNTRRPLNAILFAVRLWLTHDNFKMAQILQALLCGISVLLVASCIQQLFGKIAGWITFFILFLFSAIFIPTTLSETLGLTLGSLSFVLLWEGIRRFQPWIIGIGSMMLVVGLNARAGAFFILPLLILWAGVMLKKNHDLNAKRAFAVLTIIVGFLLGFLFNMTITYLYGDTKTGLNHSNFAQTLFGLVAGKNWQYAYEAYPNLNASEANTARFIYQESIKLFLEHPWIFFLSIIHNLIATFKGCISFFSQHLPTAIFTRYLIQSLGASLLLWVIWRLKKVYRSFPTEISFIAIGLLGMLLSAAIIWQDGNFRVFAATVPFYAAAYGIAMHKKTSYVNEIQQNNNQALKVAVFLSVMLLGSALLIPTFFFHAKQEHLNDELKFHCRADELKITSATLSHVPHFLLTWPASQFRSNMERELLRHKTIMLEMLKPELLKNKMAMASIYDLTQQKDQLIIADIGLFQTKHKLIG